MILGISAYLREETNMTWEIFNDSIDLGGRAHSTLGAAYEKQDNTARTRLWSTRKIQRGRGSDLTTTQNMDPFEFQFFTTSPDSPQQRCS